VPGSLADRLASLRRRIAHAAISAGRAPNSVTLVAVSKTVSIQSIREAYDLGLRDFGESRLQEALPKIEQLPADIRWHFIGHLQSNKARRVAQSFPILHSVENERQLDEIEKQPASVEAFVQVNLAGEAQKSGLSPQTLDNFLSYAANCHRVRIAGLMTINPADSSDEEARMLFRKLADMAKERGLNGLSMGMSSDFETAIAYGATHVRVGSLLFGDRNS
jgi:PLP dependent protein